LNGCFALVKTDEPQKLPEMAAMSLPGALGQTMVVTQMFDYALDDTVRRPQHWLASRFQAVALM
jgi:hypothetical protein